MRQKKKSHLKTKINVQRQSPERSGHGKHALFSLLAFASVSLQGGEGVTKQADSVQKGNDTPSWEDRARDARAQGM